MTLLVAVLDVPAAGAGALRAYEDRVLPLLARHGGALERRLRSPDGRTEVHVVRFATAAGREAYGADPERAAARALLDGVEVVARVVEVEDVPQPPSAAR